MGFNPNAFAIFKINNMINISSKDNSLIKHINKLNKSAKYREKNKEFVAEGVRLCVDALESGAEFSSLVISGNALSKYTDEIKKLSQKSDNSYVLVNSLFNDISNTKTPQGIICIVKALDKPTLFDKMKGSFKILALENIQDPSNLGTILRTAEAVGVDGVILSGDCCDIYSPKVVRGSMGAVFRIPFSVVESIEDFVSNHKSITSYASVVDSNALKITDVKFDDTSVLVIGNEGNGIKKSTVDKCDYKITIPMNGRAESLNASAAAAILIWEMIK